jgi:hypothetical protein
MARTVLTKTICTETNAAAGVSLVQTAADVANGNSFSPTGYDLVIANNTGAAPYTVTITSAPDAMGRTKDITAESIAAGEIRVYGPLQLLGWRQSDGFVYLSASNVAVKFSVAQMNG